MFVLAYLLISLVVLVVSIVFNITEFKEDIARAPVKTIVFLLTGSLLWPGIWVVACTGVIWR